MAIEKYAEKVERLTRETGSMTSREISTAKLFSGSHDDTALEQKFQTVTSKHLYYSIVDLSEKVDDFGELTNILSASVDGGTF